MAETEQTQIEALRGREESGEELTPTEQAQLAAFYTRVEADEETRLAPQRTLREAEKAERSAHLAGLETVLVQKRDSLQRLEMLVREIEALQQEETRLRSAVRS
jgi:hypothetical protein